MKQKITYIVCGTGVVLLLAAFVRVVFARPEPSPEVISLEPVSQIHLEIQEEPVSTAVKAESAPNLKDLLVQKLEEAENGNQAFLIHRFCQNMTLDTVLDYFEVLNALDPAVYGENLVEQMDYAIHLRWLELDSDESLRHARGTWSQDMLELRMPLLLYQWAGMEPQNAMKFCRTCTDSAEQAALLEGIVPHNPGFVAEMMMHLPDDGQRDSAVYRIVSALLNSEVLSSDQIISWAESFAGSGVFNQVELCLAQRIAEDDPETALQHIRVLSLGPDIKRENELSFIQKWAEKSPEETLDWIDQNRPSFSQSTCRNYYRTVISSFAAVDLAGTKQWLTEQENDGRLDLGIQQIARMARFSNPDEALQWAKTIVDPAVYEETLLKLKKDADSGEER